METNQVLEVEDAANAVQEALNQLRDIGQEVGTRIQTVEDRLARVRGLLDAQLTATDREAAASGSQPAVTEARQSSREQLHPVEAPASADSPQPAVTGEATGDQATRTFAAEGTSNYGGPASDSGESADTAAASTDENPDADASLDAELNT